MTLMNIPCSNLFYPEVISGDLTTLFYLATFQQDDGSLSVYGKKATKDTLMKVIPGDRYKHLFISRCLENQKLIDNGGFITLNPEVVIKDISKFDANKNNVVAVNTRNMRFVYEHYGTEANMALLGNLFRLVPYINVRYNILCFNPSEKKIKNVDFFDYSNVAEYMRNDHTIDYAKEWFLDMMDYKLVDSYHGYCSSKHIPLTAPLIRWVTLHGIGNFAIVNPQLIYTGDRLDYVNLIGGF